MWLQTSYKSNLFLCFKFYKYENKESFVVKAKGGVQPVTCNEGPDKE
jgi:hypothetical protein